MAERFVDHFHFLPGFAVNINKNPVFNYSTGPSSAFSLVLKRGNSEKWDKIAQIRFFVPFRAASLHSWLHLRERIRLPERKNGTKKPKKAFFVPLQPGQKQNEAGSKAALTRQSPSEGARRGTKFLKQDFLPHFFQKPAFEMSERQEKPKSRSALVFSRNQEKNQKPRVAALFVYFSRPSSPFLGQ
ncbi:MAG: hypothetical protein IKI42_03605 [Clostridia bacterium]|nr:hypothetical protein [Clostridia bacterium]